MPEKKKVLMICLGMYIYNIFWKMGSKTYFNGYFKINVI